MTEEEKARCRGCRGVLKHAPIVMGAESGDETFSYTLPSWHKECVPKEKQAGGAWLRK